METQTPHPIYTAWADKSTEEILAGMPGTSGGVVPTFLENLLLVRNTTALQAALTENAQAIDNSVTAFGPKFDALKKELGETKTKIETAGVRISADLQHFTAALEKASDQSTRLGRYLNRLTLALVLAAVLTAGAATFQTYEMKRQADLTAEQLRQHRQSSPALSKPQPEPNSPLRTPKQ